MVFFMENRTLSSPQACFYRSFDRKTKLFVKARVGSWKVINYVDEIIFLKSN